MTKMRARKAGAIVGLCVAAALVTVDVVLAAGNIDASEKYAWAENAGWQNWSPTHGGVTLTPDGATGYLAGYAWAENIGWVHLGASGATIPYANTAADNYGVNMDASGNLSGYAWSEVAGWINFNPTHSQVTVNTTTGAFDGYAWGERVGWIHFKNAAPAYNVRTAAFDGPSQPQGALFKFH
jgi:hypothetical protein